jgi:hypothetical protein
LALLVVFWPGTASLTGAFTLLKLLSTLLHLLSHIGPHLFELGTLFLRQHGIDFFADLGSLDSLLGQGIASGFTGGRDSGFVAFVGGVIEVLHRCTNSLSIFCIALWTPRRFFEWPYSVLQ